MGAAHRLTDGESGATGNSLVLVRMGAFSGSALSLRTELARRVPLRDVDLLPLARDVRMLPARLAATVEARRHGRVPWTKTAAWSRALQRRLTATLTLGDSSVLFVQTLVAAAPQPGLRYCIYTDRVGREGARVGGHYRSRYTPGWLAREAAFLRGAHRVFVMGPSTAEVLATGYGLPEHKVLVVGAGPNTPANLNADVDADLYMGPDATASPAPNPTVRPSSRCRRWLFVGTQWGLKGGPELIQAFTQLRSRHPDAELLLAGSRPDGPLPPGVRPLGRLSPAEMNLVYASSDAVVIPTHMEAFGIALVEALTHGLPCVASTVGNQPWIVGDAGLCVLPGDSPQLLSAMEQVTRDYRTYQTRAAARGRLLASRLTWPRVAEAVLSGFADGPP